MIVVIGAGVVGLASALAIASRGRQVCVIERRARPGLETSTHNSGVIHAGLYYPPGTLKARLCVEGRDRLYRFCVEAHVPHVKCGKLVVAQEGETTALERVRAAATANGVAVDPRRSGVRERTRTTCRRRGGTVVAGDRMARSRSVRAGARSAARRVTTASS